MCHCEERSDVAISQDPAGSQGTPGEYGNFTRRSVEDAAPYKARVFDRQLVRVGSASPRLPQPRWGLAMTNLFAVRCLITAALPAAANGGH